jgi:hypothetical protein
MSTINAGDQTIDPTVVTGTELAARLERLYAAIYSTHSNGFRPPGALTGALWLKVTGTTLELMLFDGAVDRRIADLTSGVWTVGTPSSGGTGGITQAEADLRYLQLVGGTLSGALTVAGKLAAEDFSVTSAGKVLMGDDQAARNVPARFSTSFQPQTQISSVAGAEYASQSQVLWSARASVTRCPTLVLATSHGGAVGAQTALQAGDWAGAVTFAASNGSAFKAIAHVAGIAAAAPDGSGNVLGRLNFEVANSLGSHSTIVSLDNDRALVQKMLRLERAGTTNALMQAYDNTGTTLLARISATGEVAGTGAFVNLSDARTKEAIKPIPDALERVGRLQGRAYRRVGSEEPELGFVAQEAAQAVPEAVVPFGDGGLLGVRSEAVVAVLVEAVKDLARQVAELREARA